MMEKICTIGFSVVLISMVSCQKDYPILKAHEFILQVNKQNCVFSTENKAAV